jgi:hypothetical protein
MIGGKNNIMNYIDKQINFKDEREKAPKRFYEHPEWIQGNLYENIDPESAFTGDVYLANSTGTLVSLKSGYIWEDECRFANCQWKNITPKVWLVLIDKD